MPAIIDRAPADGGEAVGVFESGAILVYLAEKAGVLLPKDLRGRKAALEWLFWQVGGLGPMAGQNHHFNRYAPEKIPYAIERYVKETNRLYGVLDRRLVAAPYLAGKEYSIADIAVYPWIVPWEMQSQDLGHFPALKRWFDAIAARPATLRAYERGAALKAPPVVTDDSRKILFGQTAVTGR
jgi:GST-like protein